MEGNKSSLRLKEQVTTIQKQVEIAEGKFTQLKKDYNSLEVGHWTFNISLYISLYVLPSLNVVQSSGWEPCHASPEGTSN